MPAPEPARPVQIQAAIAAVHADAPTSEQSDWSQIVALYDQLHAMRPNAVVALHRAIALAELDGPVAGLAALTVLDTTALTASRTTPHAPISSHARDTATTLSPRTTVPSS